MKSCFFAGIQLCRTEILVKYVRMSGAACKISSHKTIDIEHFIVNLCFTF